MFEQHLHAPACVYALADSLDATLAMCEDLQSTTSEAFNLLRVDRAAVTLVLRARQCIRELDPLQPDLVHGCAQFLVATSGLASDHPSADNLHSATPQISLPLADDHLIGGHVRLGVLAHLAGNLLDILEAHYVLYEDEQLRDNEPLIDGIAPVERYSHPT
jgi:hypothetical protein